MAESTNPTESVLGADIQIKGDLRFEKPLHLRGRLEGSATGAGALHIAPEGKVQGDIDATAVIIEGDVRGDITAADRVELKANSHYEGNLRSARLAIENGASFSGHVTVGADAAKERGPAKTAPARPANNNAKVAEPAGAR